MGHVVQRCGTMSDVTDIARVKTMHGAYGAILPGARHHFRWVMPTSTHDDMAAEMARYGITDLTTERFTLFGLEIRVDDTVPGLYLEWVA